MSKVKIGKITTRTEHLIRAGFVQPELLNKKARKAVAEIFDALEAAGAVVKVGQSYGPTPDFKPTEPMEIALAKIYTQKICKLQK